MKSYFSVLIVSIIFLQEVNSQLVDPKPFKLYPRYSFYSFEKSGEFLLLIPPGLKNNVFSVDIDINGKKITTVRGAAKGNIIRIPFNIGFIPGNYKVIAQIHPASSPGDEYSATTDLNILLHKQNEVKTDRLTGALIVGHRQFFPFGFYCYSPVAQTLPEEEVVRGFNMMSPYQTILPENLKDRQSYMDRCAELGMKVHYNLLSLCKDGKDLNRIRDEIRTFMNHPALLAWYISDEPNGSKVPPDSLEEIYRTVKETDPWHPVSMVFMAPFQASKKYADALDIVMADPYPVPNYPIGLAGDVTGQLKSVFNLEKPVWMVLQAFGGGEWWGREPTIQEIRCMTYQALINGATGIQYFIRQGLNYFPKSVSSWSECGRMAMEVAEITPWLLSDEEAPSVESSSQSIHVASRVHDGQLLIVAVNRKNEPAAVSFRIKSPVRANARVIFENRDLQVTGGVISDHLSAFGSQVYLIDLHPYSKAVQTGFPNLLKDPGFEDNSLPGVPAACYARPGGDRGATYFLDTREHHEGNHSMRFITPVQNKGISLRLFPFKVKAGASYVISIWAKADPEEQAGFVTNRKNDRLCINDVPMQFVEVELGAFGRARFEPDNEWRRYMTFITIPSDTIPSFRTNLIVRMPGKGVAWLDEMKVFEEDGSRKSDGR